MTTENETKDKLYEKRNSLKGSLREAFNRPTFNKEKEVLYSSDLQYIIIEIKGEVLLFKRKQK